MMTMPLKSLPLSVDLRPGCSPIESQENIGSCTAQALVGALEYNEIRDKTPFADMSRLFLYYNERVIRNTVKVDSGAMLRDGIKALAKTGCCHEHLWPYIPNKFTTKPPVECYTEASTKLITSYNRINSLDEMRLCLAEGSPFVFGFSVYENFESSEVAKTGILGMPSKNESMRGGHACLCVGYNDLTKQVIIRNSWGRTWGQAGYFMMPYAYIGDKNLADDMWYIKK
jgi:C1A family cysteine protease